jgi:hypothetical protein
VVVGRSLYAIFKNGQEAGANRAGMRNRLTGRLVRPAGRSPRSRAPQGLDPRRPGSRSTSATSRSQTRWVGAGWISASRMWQSTPPRFTVFPSRAFGWWALASGHDPRSRPRGCGDHAVSGSGVRVCPGSGSSFICVRPPAGLPTTAGHRRPDLGPGGTPGRPALHPNNLSSYPGMAEAGRPVRPCARARWCGEPVWHGPSRSVRGSRRRSLGKEARSHRHTVVHLVRPAVRVEQPRWRVLAETYCARLVATPATGMSFFMICPPVMRGDPRAAP